MALIKMDSARKILKRTGGSAVSILRQHCVAPKKSIWNEKLCRVEDYYDRAPPVYKVARRMEEKMQHREVAMR